MSNRLLASKFSCDIRDASSLFTHEFNSKGTRSPEQIADAYERANEATYRLNADFRDDLLAAIGLGKISPKKAEEILKANRIRKENIAMIRSGRYKKYELSGAAKKIAPKDRIKAAHAAVKRTKDNPL
jgi:(p)ppGpp synthase/HD superfamily hydrolase